jgi:uncharacterized protein YukJ
MPNARESRNIDRSSTVTEVAMALQRYGVLKGTVAGHKRDADDDHYQILVSAAKTMHRIAVNVKSSAPNAPSTLLFLAKTTLPNDVVKGLRALAPGYTKLASEAKGLALDYVRDKWFKPGAMKEVPPDKPGKDNDLKDKVERAVVDAVRQEGSLIYAFGEKWGPENKTKDKYFKFLPGNGIHDIHMNQGSSGKYKKYNGIYQDGALVFVYPNGKLLALFLAFQSQTFDTDDDGNPRQPAPARSSKAKPAVKRASPTRKAVGKRAGTRASKHVSARG